ncbi:MAG: hypothetical protein GX096_04780 [Clostridiales bacterium]|nr:hypothetical protein [Clostridiales bacterium]
MSNTTKTVEPIDLQQDNAGLHGCSPEYIKAAIRWLQNKKIAQIRILGMSMQASMALAAASLMPDISLARAFAPNDFIPWGCKQARIDVEQKLTTAIENW